MVAAPCLTFLHNIRCPVAPRRPRTLSLPMRIWHRPLRLLPDLPPGCDMAILPRSGTSLRHLTEHLRDSAPLQTLILILDGGPGYIRLGGQIIDRRAIGKNQTELTEWQQLLTADARLFLLVNGLPQSGVGHEFSHDLSPVPATPGPAASAAGRANRSVIPASGENRPCCLTAALPGQA